MQLLLYNSVTGYLATLIRRTTMNKKDLEQMEQYWEKYHRSIPDYPILERRQRRVDLILSYIMVFLLGILFVSFAMLVYFMRGGL